MVKITSDMLNAGLHELALSCSSPDQTVASLSYFEIEAVYRAMESARRAKESKSKTAAHRARAKKTSHRNANLVAQAERLSRAGRRPIGVLIKASDLTLLSTHTFAQTDIPGRT